jgi:polysaccharide biosynthesis transport protein
LARNVRPHLLVTGSQTQMFKVHLRRTLICAFIFGLLGYALVRTTKSIYEAVVELKAGSPTITADQSMPFEVRRALLPGVLTDLDSDTGILRSQRVFREGLVKAAKETGNDALATPKTFEELFPLFDLDIPQASNAYAPDQQRIVRLKVSAYSPKDAAAIANNVAFAFSDYRMQRAKEAVGKAKNIVKSLATNAQNKLKEIDAQYKSLKISAGVADLTQNNEALTTSVETLRQKRAAVEAEVAGVASEVQVLRGQIARTPQKIAGLQSSVSDPVVDGIRQLVVSAEAEYAAQRQIYQDSAPQVVRAKEKLAAVKRQLAESLRSVKVYKQGESSQANPVFLELSGRLSGTEARLSSLRSQLAPINSDILKYENRIAQVPNLETKFYDIQRNRIVFEQQYQDNKKWLEQLELAENGQASQIVAAADAEFITKPKAPEPVKYVVLATAVGFLLGLFYSFARESFQLPVHTSWQLAELTALPVAASIPATSKALSRRHVQSIPDANFRPIESFRYMAFSVLAKENKPGVVLFTGVGEEVDSSVAAAEFAVATAKTGCKTILVDCDLRVPRLSQMFGHQGRSGVADILGRTILPGESTDLVVSTQHDHLQILPAGTLSTSGLADFVTSHLDAMVGELRQKADMVVINCPPVDVFADTSRLAQYVDETCLVISAKSTSYRAIPIAQEILTKSGAKAISIVLTNASPVDEPFGTRSLGKFRTQ